MNIELKDHNLKHHASFGSQHIVVECVAHLTDIINNNRIDYGKYNIEYYRDPISGELREVKCFPTPENETTENTLITAAVEEHVSSFLQK